MNQLKHINFKDDFILRETFLDKNGNTVPIPDGIDFEIKYWVRRGFYFVASRSNNIYTNCRPSGDDLLVIFKNHNLGEGVLSRELHLKLDDCLMPDKVRNIFLPVSTGCVLWQFPSDASDFSISSTVDIGSGTPDLDPRIIVNLLRSASSAFLSPGFDLTPHIITPGVIPLFARPGLIYRDCGRITLPLPIRSTPQPASRSYTLPPGFSFDDINVLNATERTPHPVQHTIDFDPDTRSFSLSLDGGSDDNPNNGIYLFLDSYTAEPLHPNGKREYITRTPDGRFISFDSSFALNIVAPHPVLRPLKKVGHNLGSLWCLLYDQWQLPRSILEVQHRRRVFRRHSGPFGPYGGRKTEWGGANYRWKKVNPRKKPPRMGVFRIRLRTRRGYTPWAVFSFHYKYGAAPL